MSAGPSVDPEVLAYLRKGDSAAAVTCALQAYGPRLLGYFTLVLRDDDAAEEVYATFCERLWAGIASFRGEAQFRTWAFQIAHNVLCTHRADPYRRRGQRLSTDAQAKLTAAAREGTPLFRQTEARSAVERLRGQLEPEERALLALRVDQKLSWREITQVMADEEGVTEAALRKRFERIKDRLRAFAEAAGLLRDDDAHEPRERSVDVSLAGGERGPGDPGRGSS
jgi:RNA polymerase sigma-70 factor, ECF subfamily